MPVRSRADKTESMHGGSPGDNRGHDFIIIALAAGVVLGLILTVRSDSRQIPAPIQSVNDLSRWATVYSLVERGTYNIDESPWPPTIDRVRLNGHFYSSKPALLPTILAAEYVLLKKLSLGRLSFSSNPEAVIRIIIVTVNLIPFMVFLVLYARLFEEVAPDSWVRTYAVVATGFGTLLSAFSVTLNNHTIAATSAAFSIYAGYRLWRGSRELRHFAAGGFFAGFSAVNELPAVAFLAVAAAFLLWRAPRRTLAVFVPFALLPVAAHFVTNYAALGTLAPAYAQKSAYDFPGSYWKLDPESGRLVSSETDPQTGKAVIRRNIDSLYEPWPVYLFHMLAGHHGILSLSPMFLFSFLGIWLELRDRASPLRPFAGLAAFLTVLLLVFYLFFAGQRNYGGATAGLRWLFWLIPFWLLLLPAGLRGFAAGRGRRGIALLCLAVSAMSVFYAARNPWSRPWLHQWLNYMGWIWY